MSIWALGWDWNFSEWENNPQPLLNPELLWKLVYVADLIIFHNGFSLKLQGIIILKCQIDAAVKVILMRRNVVWIQIMSSCFIYFTCQKLKQGVGSTFPHQFAADTVPRIKVQFEQWFLELSASKGFFKFQNPFNCPVKELSSHLPLDQHNDKLKCMYQQKNLILWIPLK